MSVAIHKVVVRRGAFGGELLTTLCGRMSEADDDMNVADDGEPITCKLCLTKMRQQATHAAASASRA